MSGAPGRLPHPPDVPRRAPGEPPGWFDRAKNVRLLKWIGCLSVAVLFALDFLLHYHEWLGLERVPGFYTLLGFLASVVLIAAAKIGGKPLKRREGHYDG